MAKWFGKIGFSETVLISPGVWEPRIVEKNYIGEVYKRSSRWNNQQNSTNDNISIDSVISILSDPYSSENFTKIIYIEYMNNKWKVNKITPAYPRIELDIGGLYNG